MDENGNDIQQLTTITVRATEFTTPESMPAVLPPNSAYTYCVELAVDGVKRVRFEKPVITWVDNFLGFDVGEVVPVGYYDRDRGVWVPSDNGVVVKLLDTDADGIVDAMVNYLQSESTCDYVDNDTIWDESSVKKANGKLSKNGERLKVDIQVDSKYENTNGKTKNVKSKIKGTMDFDSLEGNPAFSCGLVR